MRLRMAPPVAPGCSQQGVSERVEKPRHTWKCLGDFLELGGLNVTAKDDEEELVLVGALPCELLCGCQIHVSKQMCYGCAYALASLTVSSSSLLGRHDEWCLLTWSWYVRSVLC